MTISHPPERTATPAELCDESARIERALSGQQKPRTLHALIEQGARLVPCGHCGRGPGVFCLAPYGCYHLARFAEGRHRGLITANEMATVIQTAGDVFTAATLIRDGER
jgi:hypothetical protein